MPGRSDPLVGFHFAVDMGKAAGLFQEISGLSSENEIIEGKYVNDKGIEMVMKQPGRLKWGDITLKRGITENLDMWKWRKMVEEGKIKDARVNVTITMFDQMQSPVATWELENAWPSKLSGPQMQSDGNAVGVEELTLVCEAMWRTQ